MATFKSTATAQVLLRKKKSVKKHGKKYIDEKEETRKKSIKKFLKGKIKS